MLAGSSVGLLAATMGRLYNSSFYALSDTRTPLKFAIIRVTLTLMLGYLFAIPLPPLLGLAPKWGVAGLTTSAGLAAWVEFSLLRWSLNRRLGWTGLPRPYLARLWLMALTASAAAVAVKFSIHAGPRLTALAVLPIFGAVYLGMAYWMEIPELDRVSRLRPRPPPQLTTQVRRRKSPDQPSLTRHRPLWSQIEPRADASPRISALAVAPWPTRDRSIPASRSPNGSAPWNQIEFEDIVKRHESRNSGS